MDRVIFTRLELYNLVWQFPMNFITKNYDISSMEIKNACDKMKIPLPGSKHWTKFKCNRNIPPALSDNYTGSNQIRILKKMYQIQLRNTPNSTPLLDLIKSIQKDSNAPLSVPSVLTNPSKIILHTQAYWDAEKMKKNNKSELSKILHFSVSSENVPRVLRLLDVLIKLLEYRGHRFEKSIDKTGVIFMNNVTEIDIHLREGLKRIPPREFQDSSMYIQTGEFIMQIRKDSYKNEWRDGKISLEKCLARIVARLELIAIEEKHWKDAFNM